MISNSLKNVLGLLFWGLGCVAVLAATYMIAMANYLGTSYSFYLQRMDSQPLKADRLVGGFFAVFAKDASLNEFYSAGLTIGLSIGLFLAWNELFAIFDSVAMSKRHRAAGNLDEALAFKTEAIHQIIVTVMLLCLLAPIVRWDLAMFEYRGSAGQLANQEDAINLQTWAEIRGVPDFATELTELGALGYACLTGITCLSLELTARKARVYGTRILMQLDNLATPDEPQDEQSASQQYEVAGQGVRFQDTNVPIASDESGNEQTASTDEHTNSHESAMADEPPSPSEPLFVVPPMETNSSTEVPGVTSAPPSKPRTREQQPPSCAPRTAPAETTVEVVGGAGERVSLRAALADTERYFVDKATGRVWSRSYFESIHSEQQQQPESEDATEAA